MTGQKRWTEKWLSLIHIYAAASDSDSKEMIIDYYTEIGGCTDETVFWLGYPLSLIHI